MKIDLGANGLEDAQDALLQMTRNGAARRQPGLARRLRENIATLRARLGPS